MVLIDTFAAGLPAARSDSIAGGLSNMPSVIRKMASGFSCSATFSASAGSVPPSGVIVSAQSTASRLFFAVARIMRPGGMST